jgi:hypothetical protein
MGHVERIAVNGWECSALVVPLDGGLRVQFAEEDWDIVDARRVSFVPVRRPGRDDAWVTAATETRLPPVVWVTLTERGNRVRPTDPRHTGG